MRTFLSRSVLGAILVSLTLGAATAQAAGTGPVTVRVEGAGATLIPPTLVATRSGTFSPTFDPAHTCPGTSAAYALELATFVNSTSWSGTFFSFGDYLVTTIAGETYPSTGSAYWSFWYDRAPAQVGICGQQLNPNDEILFFPDCFGNCGAGYVSPNVLGMSAPTVAEKGSPIAVTATSYASADGTPSPAAGATVSGGGASTTTSSGGSGQLTFPTVGTFTLRATAAHAIRSEPHTICVHDGNDGNCGTTAPPGGTPTTTSTTPTTTTGGSPSPSATTTNGPPHGHLAIHEGAVFAHGHGPHLILGTIEPDPTGLRTVALRLFRQVSTGRCEAFNAKRRKFTAGSCGILHAPSFAIGRSYAFSYLLPSALGPGRYTLQVSAIDGAGKQDGPAPGRNRIVFRVR
jgi:hypothetical protein